MLHTGTPYVCMYKTHSLFQLAATWETPELGEDICRCMHVQDLLCFGLLY